MGLRSRRLSMSTDWYDRVFVTQGFVTSEVHWVINLAQFIDKHVIKSLYVTIISHYYSSFVITNAFYQSVDRERSPIP